MFQTKNNKRRNFANAGCDRLWQRCQFLTARSSCPLDFPITLESVNRWPWEASESARQTPISGLRTRVRCPQPRLLAKCRTSRLRALPAGCTRPEGQIKRKQRKTKEMEGLARSSIQLGLVSQTLNEDRGVTKTSRIGWPHVSSQISQKELREYWKSYWKLHFLL